RAADVHEQKQANVVTPRRSKDELDLARVATGLVDRFIEVELGCLAESRELPQSAERDFDAPHIEDAIGSVVAESPLGRHLHRRTPDPGATDADPAWMLPAVAERRSAARADPAVAAVVALGLLFECLEEAAHQLLGREPFELGEIRGREIRGVLRIAEPFEELCRDLVAERAFHAPEHARKHAIIRVEVGLALHQKRAAEVIEAKQARSMEVLFDGAKQRLPFLDRNRYAFGAQSVEEIEEHGKWLRP